MQLFSILETADPWKFEDPKIVKKRIFNDTSFLRHIKDVEEAYNNPLKPTVTNPIGNQNDHDFISDIKQFLINPGAYILSNNIIRKIIDALKIKWDIQCKECGKKFYEYFSSSWHGISAITGKSCQDKTSNYQLVISSPSLNGTLKVDYVVNYLKPYVKALSLHPEVPDWVIQFLDPNNLNEIAALSFSRAMMILGTSSNSHQLIDEITLKLYKSFGWKASVAYYLLYIEKINGIKHSYQPSVIVNQLIKSYDSNLSILQIMSRLYDIMISYNSLPPTFTADKGLVIKTLSKLSDHEKTFLTSILSTPIIELFIKNFNNGKYAHLGTKVTIEHLIIARRFYRTLRLFLLDIKQLEGINKNNADILRFLYNGEFTNVDVLIKFLQLLRAVRLLVPKKDIHTSNEPSDAVNSLFALISHKIMLTDSKPVLNFISKILEHPEFLKVIVKFQSYVNLNDFPMLSNSLYKVSIFHHTDVDIFNKSYDWWLEALNKSGFSIGGTEEEYTPYYAKGEKGDKQKTPQEKIASKLQDKGITRQLFGKSSASTKGLYRSHDRYAQEHPEWANKKFLSEYARGVRLAPLFKKIITNLNALPKQFKLVIHGRDGEAIYRVAQKVDSALASRMIYVLTSRPLTTQPAVIDKSYEKYVNKLIPKDVPGIHVDTGFAGSIPEWFKKNGWDVRRIALISADQFMVHALDYALMGRESISSEIRDTVLTDIEHSAQRLEELGYGSKSKWGDWRFSKNAPGFWARINGIVDNYKINESLVLNYMGMMLLS